MGNPSYSELHIGIELLLYAILLFFFNVNELPMVHPESGLYYSLIIHFNLNVCIIILLKVFLLSFPSGPPVSNCQF